MRLDDRSVVYFESKLIPNEVTAPKTLDSSRRFILPLPFNHFRTALVGVVVEEASHAALNGDARRLLRQELFARLRHLQTRLR